MTPAYLVLALAAVVVAAVISFHRYLGLLAMAVGGIGVTYFLMDPVYTFRVSQTRDIGALSVYGVFGMLVTTLDQKKSAPLRDSQICRHGAKRAYKFAPVDDEHAPLLDAYHLGLLEQLCAEINRTGNPPLDLRDVMAVALRRLEKKVESEGAVEILDEARLELEYEQWAAFHLSTGEEQPSPKKTDLEAG